MAQKVLIPVDGSDQSLQVLPAVLRLLPPARTELILFHVTALNMERLDKPEPTAPTPAVNHVIASVETAFRAAMQPQVQELNAAGFAVQTVVRFGDPTAEIERYLAEAQIDLVAMTTHGRTGLARALLGSVAQHLINHAAVPVLLMRAVDHPTAAS
jgi:nucleotide-binding universal stress UspA family protein